MNPQSCIYLQEQKNKQCLQSSCTLYKILITHDFAGFIPFFIQNFPQSISLYFYTDVAYYH